MRFFFACALSVFLSLPAAAQEAPIEGTIQGQIDAMMVDDFTTAFTFASPNIKTIFGTAENFGMMVRQGYPMVYQPRDVRMGELREVAGALWQRVYVTDADGRGHVLDYQMVETPDGWKINAVRLLRAEGIGA
ncbi:MAG: DUF4864 domain-containing protein [Paracoccaceae bacterium]